MRINRKQNEWIINLTLGCVCYTPHSHLLACLDRDSWLPELSLAGLNSCFIAYCYSDCLTSTVGHGQSEGDRMNIKDFQMYIRDSLQHIDLMKSRHPGLPVFIVGHSMVGGMHPILEHFWNGQNTTRMRVFCVLYFKNIYFILSFIPQD